MSLPIVSKITLEEKIIQLHVKYKDLPKQKSKQWLLDRLIDIFGGSTINILDDTNPYSSEKKFVASLTGIEEGFSGNLYTLWGNLTEPLSNELISTVFETKIYEFGGIPGPVKYLRFSPDGVAIMELVLPDDFSVYNLLSDNNSGTRGKKGVNKKYRSDLVVRAIYDKNVKWIKKIIIALIEFKCPFVKIPSGFIPEIYIPQLLTGMCCLPVDISIFVNCTYRTCSWKQWKNNTEYNKCLFKSDPENIFDQVLAMGMMVLYMTSEQERNFRKMFHLPKQGYMYDSDNDDDDEYSNIDKDFIEHQEEMKELNSKYEDIDDLTNILEYIKMKVPKLVYKISELLLASYASEIKPNFNCLLDYGESGFNDMQDLLDLIQRSIISVNYIPMVINKENFLKIPFCRKQDEKFMANYSDDFEKLVKKYRKNILQYDSSDYAFGFIPWKLFICDIVPQALCDKNYLNKKENDLIRVKNIVDEIRSSENPREIFCKYYS